MKKIFLITGILFISSIVLIGCGKFAGEEEVSGQADIDISDSGEASEDVPEAEDDPVEEGSSSDDNNDGTALQEEYFVSAILKGVDLENEVIFIEQLINDPDGKIIEPEVVLSPDYKVVRSELKLEDSEEKYTDIILDEIPLESEIGIMLGGDGMAKLIIYQVIIDISQEELLGNTVLGFLGAVIADEEYDYFSTGTISMVGTEQEYINGDKSDIYFIIKESHSSWENVVIAAVRINGGEAEVDIIGDRMAEGTKYEGDMVTFRLVDEQGTWKIDFSS